MSQHPIRSAVYAASQPTSYHMGPAIFPNAIAHYYTSLPRSTVVLQVEGLTPQPHKHMDSVAWDNRRRSPLPLPPLLLLPLLLPVPLLLLLPLPPVPVAPLILFTSNRLTLRSPAACSTTHAVSCVTLSRTDATALKVDAAGGAATPFAATEAAVKAVLGRDRSRSYWTGRTRGSRGRSEDCGRSRGAGKQRTRRDTMHEECEYTRQLHHEGGN